MLQANDFLCIKNKKHRRLSVLAANVAATLRGAGKCILRRTSLQFEDQSGDRNRCTAHGHAQGPWLVGFRRYRDVPDVYVRP